MAKFLLAKKTIRVFKRNETKSYLQNVKSRSLRGEREEREERAEGIVALKTL